MTFTKLTDRFCQVFDGSELKRPEDISSYIWVPQKLCFIRNESTFLGYELSSL